MLDGRYFCTARRTHATILTWYAPCPPPNRDKGVLRASSRLPYAPRRPTEGGSGWGTPKERIQERCLFRVTGSRDASPTHVGLAPSTQF